MRLTQNKKRVISAALSFVLMLSMSVTTFAADFKYSHDPMQDERAKYDIVVNENAVYGYSPNPDSVRLGEFAKYDWSDEKLVESSRKERTDYHERTESELLALLEKGKKNGDSVETIARAVSAQRNAIRLEEAEDAGTLEETKKSNFAKYGNENGPTPESLYEKYGSWETVAAKAFSINLGMDVCLGLYDKYYDTYDKMEDLFAKQSNTLTVKKKTVEISTAKLLSADKTFTIKPKNAIGKVVIKPADAASKKVLSVNSKGKVTVLKGTAAGTYKIKVVAKGNDYYKKKTTTVKVVVK